MNSKFSKVLFALSRNSREKLKVISKKIKSSEQNTFYIKKQLEKKKIISSYELIVDPVKLGYNNVIVGINFIGFDSEKIHQVVDYISKIPTVIVVQLGDEGVDLVVEFCEKNLSAFNKTYHDFVYKFQGSVQVKFISPVIVRHRFPRNYLIRKTTDEDMILCGDREQLILSDKEIDVLMLLLAHPTLPIVALTKKTDYTLHTVTQTKQKLENKGLIKGYTCSINVSKSGIGRELLLLKISNQDLGKINKLIEYVKQQKNVIEIIKIIGPFHIALTLEGIESKRILPELRSTFLIENYMIIPIKDVKMERFFPID